jgi:deoxyribose-phosphate aldolase
MNDLLDNLNRRFDHAALMPEVDEPAVRKLCQEAIEHQFYAVAVNPVWVKTAADELRGSTVKILSVAGFPLSASRTDIKLAEAVKGVNDGAHEIDMVANVGWLVSGRYKEVEAEIAEIRRNLPFNVVLKVIIEAGNLSTSY